MDNIFKMFYSKNSMKRKILDIVYDIKVIIESLYKEKFWIDWYGAYDINPKYLVIWICVESDKTKLWLESNKELINKFNQILVKNSYPEEAIPFVQIGFESQETVDR